MHTFNDLKSNHIWIVSLLLLFHFLYDRYIFKECVSQTKQPHSAALTEPDEWFAVLPLDHITIAVPLTATMICGVEIELLQQLIQRFPSLLTELVQVPVFAQVVCDVSSPNEMDVVRDALSLKQITMLVHEPRSKAVKRKNLFLGKVIVLMQRLHQRDEGVHDFMPTGFPGLAHGSCLLGIL